MSESVGYWPQYVVLDEERNGAVLLAVCHHPHHQQAAQVHREHVSRQWELDEAAILGVMWKTLSEKPLGSVHLAASHSHHREPDRQDRHQRRLGHLELPELNESCRNEFCVLENPLDGLILPEKFLLHREVVIAVGDDCDICGFLLRDYK